MHALSSCVERHVERGPTLHAERGGVDKHACIARAVDAVAPIVGLHARAEVAGDRVGAGTSAVEDADLLGAGLQKRMDDGAGRTAGAEHGYGASLGVEARIVGDEIVHEADAVGVLGHQPIALEPKRVGGAHGARGGLLLIGDSKGRLLVRDRHIAAGEALGAHAAQESDGILRLDGPLHVAAVDPVLLEPMAVDQRRARMRDRPADDARALSRPSHTSIAPRALNSASSGSSGRPRMVK